MTLVEDIDPQYIKIIGPQKLPEVRKQQMKNYMSTKCTNFWNTCQSISLQEKSIIQIEEKQFSTET